MELDVRRASFEDAALIGTKLRKCDEDELRAAVGDPVAAVRQSIINSRGEAFIVVDKNSSPVYLWGLCPTENPNVGVPWAVGTDLFYDYISVFKELAPILINRMNERYPVLINAVDDRNRVAKRWLKEMGFRFIEKIEEYGVEKRPFWVFIREAK